MLWGLAAVAIPVLIHLLLKQRPKPVPWAAMQWLMAAAQASQKKWRWTHLLLLLLRCLILALLALAIARPGWDLIRGDSRILVIADLSASTGPVAVNHGGDATDVATPSGAWAAYREQLAEIPETFTSYDLLPLGQQVQHGDHNDQNNQPISVFTASSRDELVNLAQRIDSGTWPGGLDSLLSLQAVRDAVSEWINQSPNSQHIILLGSDWQQDSGEAWQEFLGSISALNDNDIRWWHWRHSGHSQSGTQSANIHHNSFITGAPQYADLIPDQATTWVLPSPSAHDGNESNSGTGKLLNR